MSEGNSLCFGEASDDLKAHWRASSSSHDSVDTVPMKARLQTSSRTRHSEGLQERSTGQSLAKSHDRQDAVYFIFF